MKFHPRVMTVDFLFICICLALYLRGMLLQNYQKQAKIVQTIYKHNGSNNVLYFTRHKFNISPIQTKSTTVQKLILFFNEPDYMRKYKRKDYFYKNCEYKNCIISHDSTKLLNADAVIFYIGIRSERMGKGPPLNTNQRNPDQAWIFTTVEPPEHYYNTDYKSVSWQSTMNWSSLYRLDSDIPNPYGILIRSDNEKVQNYISVYNAKSRNALWMVSHCQVASARRQYVNEMIRLGFQVDILGGCGSDGRKLGSEELEQIIPTYKYFLAFENSLCTDYISEKFFHNYNSSWIVVVRGGANYKRLLPEKTYINTADFLNITTLVEYLLNLGNDRNRYIEFLSKKDKYVSIRWPGNRHCEICRRLNNITQYRKVYKTLDRYLNDDQCFLPKDL